jgi:hypothetical protein
MNLKKILLLLGLLAISQEVLSDGKKQNLTYRFDESCAISVAHPQASFGSKEEDGRETLWVGLPEKYDALTTIEGLEIPLSCKPVVKNDFNNINGYFVKYDNNKSIWKFDKKKTINSFISSSGYDKEFWEKAIDFTLFYNIQAKNSKGFVLIDLPYQGTGDAGVLLYFCLFNNSHALCGSTVIGWNGEMDDARDEAIKVIRSIKFLNSSH